MADISEHDARMLLAAIAEPADLKLGKLLQRFAAVEIWKNLERLHPELSLQKSSLQLDELISKTLAIGARFVTKETPEWPTQLGILGELEPVGLWLRGELLNLSAHSIAIVGARTATEYGERTASEIAAGLTSHNCNVISGGALGIDAAAHRGAIWAGGNTVALLAGGVDIPYPRANAILFDKILEQGSLVSESPPGSPPLRHRFLIRNRLIAAWSKATVVVEARIRSGAIATASHANNLGLDVMAVPGPVNSAASVGCHQLIRDGALLVTNANEIVEQIQHLS